MSTKLNDIYRSILLFAGLEADQQGYITIVEPDKRDPVFIDGLQLVLPTENHLRNFNPKERIIFHPLTENILRGESEVIVKLKSAINVRLNLVTGVVAQSLLNLVASTEYHRQLSPEQAELLTTVNDADDKSVTNFIKLMVSGISKSPERLFTNIYLKRGGTFNGKRYSRVGIVSFPFYQQIIDDKLDNVRVKDKETYKQLFDFIFPCIDNAEEYNFGSDSHVAPYLEALMRSAANVASRLNDLIQLYSEYIDESDKLVFDSDWMEDFQELNGLIPEIRKIPVQHGNEGRAGAVEETETTMRTNRDMAPVSQVSSGPVYAGAAPVQQQQQQYPAPPEIKRTRHGLDFKSVMQANPSIAMAPNPLIPQMMQAQYQQHMTQMADRTPSWASPQPQPGQMYQGQPMYPSAPPQMQLPPGVIMTPNGPMYQTPQGWMPYNPMPPQPGPSWAAPQQAPYYQPQYQR